MASFLDSLFGSDGNGLLGLLRNNAFNQVPLNVLPSDQAQYGSQPLNAYAQYRAPQPPTAYAQSLAPQALVAYPPAQPLPQAQATPPLAGLPQAPATTSGPLQNLARIITNIPRGGLDDPNLVAQRQQAQTANLTARALINKGVDPQIAIAAVQPGNAEFLKQLVDQNFGMAQIDNLGQGYIRDRRTGKITRAYTPDDKTPSGFALDDNGNMHFVPGGPADPAYIKMKSQQSLDPNATHVLGKGGEVYTQNPDGTINVIHKNVDTTDATLSDETVKTMASQYLGGDKTVLQNLGRGAQGAANIVKLREEITKQANAAGLNGADIGQRMIDYIGDTARERTAATQEGRMAPAGFEAAGAISLARQASAAVPRGNWVPINKAIQYYEKNAGDPAIRAFGAANTTLINTYARAINPNGVGTVADKEHAREMLSTADSPAAYEAVLQQLEKEIQMAHNSPAQARAAFKADRANRLGRSAEPASFSDRFTAAGQFGASQPATTGKTANGVSWGIVQ